MTKIVVNRCYGGFSISQLAAEYLAEAGNEEAKKLLNKKPSAFGGHPLDTKRDDPVLVEVVERLGSQAGGSLAELEVVTIPDDVEWQIEEYDGQEWVAEKHRTW